MSAGRSSHLSPEFIAEPTSMVSDSRPLMDREDEWEVVGAGDVRTTSDPFPPSAQDLDRESLLLEAGRLYGRDTARERAALLDGSHPLQRRKRPAA
jgi:hypothetical protein